MDNLIRDLKHAVRALRASPGFTTVALLTLALGIGANTAIFSVINAVLLRPLPYLEPDRLVTVEHYYPSLNGGMEAPVSVPGFRDYQAHEQLFEKASVRQGWGPTLTAEGAEPERLIGARASGDFFPTYGVMPLHGRVFRADEATDGNNRVVVLSHALWTRRFGGDVSMIGRPIILNGESYEVIGVMPPSFFDFFGRRAELWSPIVFSPNQYSDNNRTNEFLGFTGRLRPGVTIERARDDLHAYAVRVRQEFSQNYPPDWDLHVTALADEGIADLRRALYVLLGAVGFVLLIACANVANLQLARMSARSREIAVRVAIGASPRRLVSQLLTESVVLAVAGGALGLLIAVWGVPALLSLNANAIPANTQVGVDPSVLGYTLLISLATGLVFGMMPAWQVARANVHGELKEGARGAGADRGQLALRRGLVVSTLALALTLTAGAGLLIRSFSRLVGVDPGFQTSNLATFNVALPASKYPNDTVRIQAVERIVAAVEAVPGVRSAGATSVLPFGGGWSTASFTVEGFTPPQNQPGPWGDIRIVTPGYLSTLGVPLRRGRLFNAGDVLGSLRVAVVDEEMVSRFWPNDDPIGKRITFNAADSTQWITVVGVVGHTMHEGLDGQRRVQLYFSARQAALNFATMAVKANGDPASLMPSLRAAVRSVDGDLPISNVNTMDGLIEQSTGPRRFAMLLLGIFAALAVGLASIGLYGVMSYMVTQRTREIGVRVALGAARRDVVRMVLGQGMKLAVAGVVIGLAGALAATQLMKSMLFNVGARDPLTFIAISLLLAGIALLASWLPARRAAAVDPMVALRNE